jgi:hypothetical protein
MNNSFFLYLQQLELMAFFSGYPLLYAVIHFIAGKRQSTNKSNKNTITSFLPFAYALVGTLYLGLQLKNLYPDYSFENIKLSIQQPFLVIWGLLSILFWIPALSKKSVLSLIHSLVFFFFLIRDLFLQSYASAADKNIVKNDMKIYTDSLLLNLGAIAFIALLFFIVTFLKNRFNP